MTLQEKMCRLLPRILIASQHIVTRRRSMHVINMRRAHIILQPKMTSFLR